MKTFSENVIVLDAIFVSAVIISSIFTYVFMMPRYVQPIFPMWILNEYNQAPESQMIISNNESRLLYVGIENKMRRAEYCEILVKFRNLTLPIPSTANSTPAPMAPILNYSFFLARDGEWKTTFEFRIIGEEQKDSFLTHSLEVNGQMYETNLRSSRRQKSEGYYYQFIFELWLFNETSKEFYFSGVWVSSPFLQIS